MALKGGGRGFYASSPIGSTMQGKLDQIRENSYEGMFYNFQLKNMNMPIFYHTYLVGNILVNNKFTINLNSFSIHY